MKGMYVDLLGRTPGQAEIDNWVWALGHGLDKECAAVMDEAVKLAKESPNPTVAAFQKVKADLDRPVAGDNSAASAWAKLLPEYTVSTGPQHHYALLHPRDTEAPNKAAARHAGS